MHSVQPVTYGMDDSKSLTRDIKFILKQLFHEHKEKHDGPYNLDLVVTRVIKYRMGYDSYNQEQEETKAKQDIWQSITRIADNKHHTKS